MTTPLRSRDLRPLNRYFPELEAGLWQALPTACVLDGEVVIAGPKGLDFEALQQRIHPAASRIQLLARETPAEFVAFDLLATAAANLTARPQAERRQQLERGAGPPGRAAAPDAVDDRPRGGGRLVRALRGRRPGRGHRQTRRGFRWHKVGHGTALGSLLLGLYDDQGVLHYVGGSSSFKTAERRRLVAFLEPYRGPSGFGQGRTPGEPNRWTGDRDINWEPLRPELVCEVAFDHLQGERFRHGATFRRWRYDKPPRECTFAQVEEIVPSELKDIFGV